MVEAMGDAPRGYTAWEEVMLAEYLAGAFPNGRVINRQRLGPDGATYSDPRLSDGERRLLGAAFRRWADAVVIDAGVLLVVEAAMVPDPRDISLVQTYLRLVAVTPELAPFRALPRRGRLVWAVDDEFSRAVAVEHGLEVALFRPSNFNAWLTAKRASAPRQARAAVTTLGVDLPD